MAVYGYIKREYPVATSQQLAEIVNYKITELFMEDAGLEAPSELRKLLANLSLNDQLVIYDLQVLWGDSKKTREIFEQLAEKKIRLISLNNQLDTQENKYFFENVLLTKKSEEEHRSYYIRQRIQQERLKGKKHGRPQVDKKVIQQIQFLASQQKYTMREISEMCHVSLGSVHKYTRKSNEIDVKSKPLKKTLEESK